MEWRKVNTHPIKKNIMDLLEKFGYCPVCGSSHFAKNSAKSKKCSNCGFEYFMNPASAVVAIITNDRGELLVERRKCEPARHARPAGRLRRRARDSGGKRGARG